MNIGEAIKARFELEPKGHTVTWFARQLNCHRVNIYDIFHRTTIDTQLLYRISVILNYNFFQLLADDFNNSRTEKHNKSTHEL